MAPPILDRGHAMAEALDDYKKEVEAGMTASLEWQQDLVFTATTRRGYDLDFDANIEMGCMPVEGVLMSLAGCMAIDVVAILKKMRCEIEAFRMDVEGERNRTPPQRIRSIKLTLHIKGDGVTEDKAKRAVKLSEEKYCSVRHSLREDIAIETDLRIESSG
jgi:putative redox protein